MNISDRLQLLDVRERIIQKTAARTIGEIAPTLGERMTYEQIERTEKYFAEFRVLLEQIHAERQALKQVAPSSGGR